MSLTSLIWLKLKCEIKFEEVQYHVCRYTNGQVKFWDIEADEDCVFQPSSVALALDDSGEGTVGNHVTQLIMNESITVAGFSQGKSRSDWMKVSLW